MRMDSSHSQMVSLIWNIADDVLRDVFLRGQYRDVILPMVVLRRLDALLEPTKEEVEEVLQISLEMRRRVKEQLKKNGVDSARLTAVGRGGSQPVVARSDKDNWWKNRRVEFILNK